MIFDKSNFSALFSNLIRTEKSAGNFDLSKIRAHQSRSNIFSPLKQTRKKNLILIFSHEVICLISLILYFETLSTLLQTYPVLQLIISKLAKKMTFNFFKQSFFNMLSFLLLWERLKSSKKMLVACSGLQALRPSKAAQQQAVDLCQCKHSAAELERPWPCGERPRWM